MLSAPAATAASAHRRARLWNSCLHWGLQNFLGEPPRRSVTGAAHHTQIIRFCELLAGFRGQAFDSVRLFSLVVVIGRLSIDHIRWSKIGRNLNRSRDRQ